LPQNASQNSAGSIRESLRAGQRQAYAGDCGRPSEAAHAPERLTGAPRCRKRLAQSRPAWVAIWNPLRRCHLREFRGARSDGETRRACAGRRKSPCRPGCWDRPLGGRDREAGRRIEEAGK